MGFTRSGRNPLRIPMRKQRYSSGQDFSFAYEDQQGRIYYNPHQEKEATEYTLYLTVADSLKGSTATVSSLFSPEVGGETHIVIDSGKTQFFQKAHTLAGVVVQVREISGLWLLLSVLVWVFSLGILFASAGWKRGSDTVQIRWIDRIPFGIYTGISGLAFLGCLVWYAFIWEICLCKMQESYSVFHFLQLRLHWQN